MTDCTSWINGQSVFMSIIFGIGPDLGIFVTVSFVTMMLTFVFQ